ncbi:MAG: DUF4864 domain-containing protein, partial [Myxococcota bacterium]
MLALLFSLTLARADDPGVRSPEAPIVAPAEAAAMREVIDDQIGAFRRDDAAGAWRHVAPGLKDRFGTADRFLEMVRVGYPPMYRPRSYVYRDIV